MARKPAANLPNPANFLSGARVVALVTLLSRVLGLGRETIAAAAFGAGPVWSAFTVAFTVPNLFRKLFGEGALSAAFVPMYARAVESGDAPASGRFARQAVNLLAVMLAVITLVGEGALLVAIGAGVGAGRADYRLALVLTAVMLPYVLFVCGAAFLGGVLNVHGRFALPAAASVTLNLCLIAAIGAAAWAFDLTGDPGRRGAVTWLSVAVVVSGVLQVLVLLPGLKRVGFTIDPRAGVVTPATRAMLRATVPVALSAAVLQVGVLLDKGVAFLLAAAPGEAPGGLYAMASGAAARLNWAQVLYQFPLGVFAVALATAIFPALSRAAAAEGGRNSEFRDGVRRGVEAALFLGLPASAGLVLVADDAVRVLYERGQFTPFHTRLTAASVAVYSAAVWAFALQQIVNRGFYALRDARTPLVWGGVNLAINVAVEMPLVYLLPRPYGEVGMAAGTLVSFSVQAVVTAWLLSRRVGGVGFARSLRPVAAMLLGTAAMTLACLSLRSLPGWPAGETQGASVIRLLATVAVGGGVYLGLARLLRPAQAA